jgi:thiol:disulfide interchange protein DsbA
MAGAAFVSSSAQAQGKPMVAGTDYMVLEQRAPVEAPAGKIEVVEFFWYSCSHCNAFVPAFEAWRKRAPKDIAVRLVPIAFQQTDGFVLQQRLYYALEAMGLVESLHDKVFTAIHVDKKNFNKVDVITDWVVKQGVDSAKFLEQFNSFSVSTKAKRATQLQNEYLIDGVPALGVAGRYLTGGMAGSMERALKVVEFLADQVRTKR